MNKAALLNCLPGDSKGASSSRDSAQKKCSTSGNRGWMPLLTENRSIYTPMSSRLAYLAFLDALLLPNPIYNIRLIAIN